MSRLLESERKAAAQEGRSGWLREAGGRQEEVAVAGQLCVQPRERANRRLPSFFNQPPRQGLGAGRRAGAP